MVQLYTTKGLQESAARSIVTAMATAPNFFVDVMMMVRARVPLTSVFPHGFTSVFPLGSQCRTLPLPSGLAPSAQEELQMSPPPALGALSVAARVGLSSIVCGGVLPLAAALLSREEPPSAALSSHTFALLLLLGSGACLMAANPCSLPSHPHRALLPSLLAL